MQKSSQHAKSGLNATITPRTSNTTMRNQKSANFKNASPSNFENASVLDSLAAGSDLWKPLNYKL